MEESAVLLFCGKPLKPFPGRRSSHSDFFNPVDALYGYQDMMRFAAETQWLTTNPRIRLALVAVLATCCLSASRPSSVLAADDDSNTIDYPLIVVNAASIQRWRDHAGYMFTTAQRPEMADLVDKWMATELLDLAGIDRERPFGMMFYLAPNFVGWPIGISYVPIKNLDEALQTLALGRGTIAEVEGKRGWNTIRYSDNFLVRTRQVGNYVFLVGPDGDEATLDRLFPDPARLNTRLSSQYDIAASLLIKNVQPALKKLFIESLKQSTMAQLQQRDGEPESSYRLRRANGDSLLELMEHVILQGEEFTIGARLTPDQRHANFDIEIAGTPDSKLAKFFQNMSGKKTYFGNLLADRSTFTFSVSWLLSEKQRPLLTRYFEATQKEIADNASKSSAPSISPVLEPLFKTLIATAEAGHMDAFAQLSGDEPGQFALVAGAKLAGARNLPAQMKNLVQYAKDNSNGNDLLGRLEVASGEIEFQPVHRVEITPTDDQGKRMFGDTAHLYLCATSQAVWVAFGGDPALDKLRDAITQVALPQDPSQNRNRAPFVFSTHANNWLSVADESNPRRVSFNEKARAAFEPTNDAMQLVVRPTDSGVRLRIEFEEGFVALMGRAFASGIESGTFAPRQAGDGQRDGNDPPRQGGRQRGGNGGGRGPRRD